MIEKKTIPVAPIKGLYLDGVTVPGGLSKAENIIILPDGSMERRKFERTLADSEVCLPGRGSKEIYELLKNDGTRYIFSDLEGTETSTSAFGAELVTGSSALTAWTDVADWALDTDHWDHGGTGVTPLVGKPAVTALTKYQVVVNITCPAVSTTGNWAYTVADSGTTWGGPDGNTNKVWIHKWTHSAGATTALTAKDDFTVVTGSSYVIDLHVTHTSGTGLSVYFGDTLAGVISSTGNHTLIARFVTTVSYSALRFVPSSDWVGTINKSWPRINISSVDYWCSARKLLDPAGPNHPSNYDYTAGTHYPPSLYLDGAELIENIFSTWYTEATANIGQSVAITLGGTACGTVTASGEYTYTVTTGAGSPGTAGLTFIPTTAWGGAITKASIQAITAGAPATKSKVIGGAVTGTNEYEMTWQDVLTNLTSGDSIHPHWTALQDRAFRCDGTNINYWFQDISGYHTLGCPAPVAAPVLASGSTGSLTPGDYNVAYTYVKDYGNNYVVEGNPSPTSFITIAGNAIDVNVIACTEADVTAIRIYRTLYSESGSDLYFAEEVKNATKTVALNLADDDIGDGTVLEYDHDMPPKGKFILGAGSRLWLVDVNGVLRWSLLDKPELMPYSNYQTFDPKDGDETMGMVALRKHLLVFKRRKTWLFDMFSETTADDGTVMLSKDVVSSVYGCVASGSICAAGTDSAIWLSHAGFIYYNGGTIRNISGGDETALSRIQSIVNAFLAAGAEDFVDCVYHSERQLYHVNFLYHNQAGTSITAQRHFVYSILSDTWTEYVYRSAAGNKLYETCLTIAHDSLGREVMLVSYIDSQTGAVAYVFQGEYMPEGIADDVEILTSTGDGVTTFSTPTDTFCDSSDNVYVLADNGSIFKITPSGTKSTIVTPTQLQTALSYSPTAVFEDCRLIHVDSTNSCFYVFVVGDDAGFKYEYILKISFTGTITQIIQGAKSWLESLGTLNYADFYPTTSLLFYLSDLENTPLSYTKLQKVASPGGSQVESTYYTLSNTYGTMDSRGTYYGLQIYSDDLYLIWTHASYENIQLIKFTTITGTATPSLIDTGLSASVYTPGTFLVVSDTEIYISAIESGSTEMFYKLTYADGAWAKTDSVSGGYMIQKTNGDFAVWGSGDSVSVYDSDWTLRYTVDNVAVTGTTAVSHLVSSVEAEDIYILGGSTSTNVYKISKYETDPGDTEPTCAGTLVHVVSNYTDLGVPNEKRISRVYLPMQSQYPVNGAFYLEPDYGVNNTIHVDGESAEPFGAVSMRPFIHSGQKTWVYTNSAFDGTVENLEHVRLDVGTNGKAFRYAIRMGDVVGANHGSLRFLPPYMEVQIKGKQ